jgi:hypothetical protein
VSPERRADHPTRERLEAIDRGYRVFTARLTWYLRAFVALMCVGAIAFTYLVAVNRDRATEARDLGRQIQLERARNIRDNCVSQNARHDNTVTVVKANVDKRIVIALIDALAPVRDCELLVRRQVGR